MENSQRRLSLISNHLSNHTPKHTWFKPDGWGFNDTKFMLNEKGQVQITGDRYLYSGKILPSFASWLKSVGLDFETKTPSQANIPVDPANKNLDFNNGLSLLGIFNTDDDAERTFHSHGHTLQEMYIVKFGKFEKAVDVVAYPESELQVEGLVKLANELNVVLIPYGGGTNVTHALQLNVGESRTICSVDMSRMNKVLAVNKKNMTAVVESGIRGKELEELLAKQGVTCGHEPDSAEFSTVGGWISTRASGMKKNVYGNIEDILITVRIVTSSGTWERDCSAPRVSIGPDINQFILGHEGLFGIITQATIKVKQLPEVKVYDSIVFPDYKHGTKFMHECGIRGIRPASVRLLDNLQFVFGMALKPHESSLLTEFKNAAKKFYVTKIKGFNPETMCACTLVYEGSRDTANLQQKQINEIAAKYGGMMAGAENGIRGYFLTYMIAYIRDFGMEYNLIAESFECSIPWDRLEDLLIRLPISITNSCAVKGAVKKPFVSTRVTQLYDSGCCVYVYFAFFCEGVKDPVKIYSEIEEEAREEILNCGGSLSHHHGVGKLRKGFVQRSIGEPALSMLRSLKQGVDPKNIFATGNLI